MLILFALLVIYMSSDVNFILHNVDLKTWLFHSGIYIGDSIPLVVFAIAKIEKVKILAVLSGLKLEAELRNVHTTGTIKEKVKGFLQRKSSESSFTAHVGHSMLVLLEGPKLL